MNGVATTAVVCSVLLSCLAWQLVGVLGALVNFYLTQLPRNARFARQVSFQPVGRVLETDES